MLAILRRSIQVGWGIFTNRNGLPILPDRGIVSQSAFTIEGCRCDLFEYF
jgi:hypothetical protein